MSLTSTKPVIFTFICEFVHDIALLTSVMFFHLTIFTAFKTTSLIRLFPWTSKKKKFWCSHQSRVIVSEKFKTFIFSRKFFFMNFQYLSNILKIMTVLHIFVRINSCNNINSIYLFILSFFFFFF